MIDPILEGPIKFHRREFEPKVVLNAGYDDYMCLTYPKYHYSQSRLSFNRATLSQKLKVLGIDTYGRATVFGGYTGEFASALRETFSDVVFTDPMVQWVNKAREAGFAAYAYAAEEIPGSIIEQSSVIATFECYMPLADDQWGIFTSMRFLWPNNGIIFAESDMTRLAIREEMIQESNRFRQTPSMLNHFKLVYV